MSILSRYLLSELLRVFALTCGVLVTVIAFGAAIRPLAESLLGPLELMKYIGLATVPMLQFALPFSAGFAATIVLHRFSSDNEIVAMNACGVSYRRVLAPLMGLGAVLTLVMLVLVFSIVPRFWIMMKATIAGDITRIFVATVEERRAFAAGDLQIYADEVEEATPPGRTSSAEIAPTARLLLGGVAAIQFDEQGQPEIEFTAEYATIDVYRTGQGAYLKPALVNATVFRRSDGALVFLPEALPDAVNIGQRSLVEPKFMTIGQMLGVVRNPDAYPPIVERRRGFASVLHEADAWRFIDDSLRRGEPLIFNEPRGKARYEVHAVELDGRALRGSPRGGPDGGDVGGATGGSGDARGVRVVEFVDGVANREAAATGATLTIERDVSRGVVGFELSVVEPVVRSLRAGGAAGRWPTRVGGLHLAGFDPLPERIPGRVELAEAAGRLGGGRGPTAELVTQAQTWQTAIDVEDQRVERDLIARATQRAALSVSAPILLLLGAVLAIWRRGSTPLEVYLIAFVPAIANILLISSGEQMLKTGRLVEGMGLAWSGNAILVVLLVAAWSRMARH